MTINRREFIAGAAAGLLAVNLRADATSDGWIKAVAFDAFPIFDPRPIWALVEELFPGKGAELSAAWRTRQFEYTWLRTMSRRYADFRQTTEDALVFATKSLKLELDEEKRRRLMAAYFNLKAWPDVLPALKALKAAGVRLGFLSNFTREMLDANIKGAGLEGYFEAVLSTDQVGVFKPEPRAYEMGTEAFKLKREEIVFAAFAGWDAAGAKAFGYPTFWVNRQGSPTEELGVQADATGTLGELVEFVRVGRGTTGR